MAELHPQLLEDCVVVGRFSLCHLLLMQDANYPWFILVPDREGVREIYQLEESDQQQLLRESGVLGKGIMKVFHGDKLNVAALGNVVPQLHVHHVVRYRTDPAWPEPVWGRVPAQPYSEQALSAVLAKLGQALPDGFVFRV